MTCFTMPDAADFDAEQRNCFRVKKLLHFVGLRFIAPLCDVKFT
jgi:hypothetical protein